MITGAWSGGYLPAALPPYPFAVRKDAFSLVLGGAPPLTCSGGSSVLGSQAEPVDFVRLYSTEK
jgi:hypothetical protein